VALAAWRSGLTSPPPTYLLVDRHGTPLGEAGSSGDDAGYWPVDPLPPRVAAAALALEDRRFRHHPGVDPLAVARALGQNLRHRGRVSGASTIAMQVARMQHPGKRTYLRKGVEALTAVFLTARHGRDMVLAQYLRIVPYGNRIHGIRYAARRYLDKPVEDLSWAETAFLAAIPRAPARMNPMTPSGRARALARARRILHALHEDGTLSRAEHDTAASELDTLRLPPAADRPPAALHAVLRLERDLRSMATPPGVVHTTLDLPLQEEASRIVRESVYRWQGEGARNGALIVLDRRDHSVRAWVGSTGYFDGQRAGSIDYTTVARSPGSALKPFLYAMALDRGAITAATILDDLERGPGGITNMDDLFLGPLLPRVALGNSRNVPAALLVSRLGVDEAWDLYRDLGLHEGTESARRYGLGLALGGLPVTLEQLVGAYTTLSSGGRRAPLRWHADQALSSGRRVLSEDAAREVVLYLADPQARMPSFPRMGSLEMPFPVAVKTGTSSRFRDAWAVALSPRYLLAAWVGDPDFGPMNRVTGYRAAAEIVKQVLLLVHGDQLEGLSDVGFPPPRGRTPVRLCGLTGRRATEACDRVTVEWMRPGEAPMDACHAHVHLAIDTRDGRLATTRTPGRFVEARTFVDLPPAYAAWAAAAGLQRPPLTGDAGRTLERLPRVRITSPASGLRLLRDPETPPGQSTLALRAVVDVPTAQVVWYVDGKPFEVADYPYTARWPLSPGDHVIQARLPMGGAASGLVRVTIQ
jgi:penicillin-binding protein 1C